MGGSSHRSSIPGYLILFFINSEYCCLRKSRRHFRELKTNAFLMNMKLEKEKNDNDNDNDNEQSSSKL